MRHTRIFGFLLLLLIGGCIYLTEMELQNPFLEKNGKLDMRKINNSFAPKMNETPLEEEILKLINEERVKKGLNPLDKDDGAGKVARKYAERMLKEKFFSHYTPEGGDVGTRVDAAGINYARVGENLALIEGLENVSKRAVEGWIKSPRHYEVMFDPSFTSLGVGAACNEEVCYIVSIYLEKRFSLEINLNSTIAYVKVPLNSPAEVSVKANDTATFIILDEENLEKFKEGKDYVKYGEWRGNGFLTTITPDDYIVVFSNSSINLTVEIE